MVEPVVHPDLVHMDADAFEVDGATFRVAYSQESTAEWLCIAKSPDLINAYARLIEDGQPKTIVELGIFGGGSTALLALLASPRKLVALELDPDPLPGLAAFIDARGIGGSVRPFYGVDQGDRARVTEIVEQEFGSDAIDLVVDDASHLLVETRASFETLFPRLRPGGVYVIEDWAAHHQHAAAVVATTAADAADPMPPERPALERLGRLLQSDQPERYEPITRLLLQLILARAVAGDAVAEISVDANWIVVRRGSGALDPRTFRVADLYVDHFGLTR